MNERSGNPFLFRVDCIERSSLAFVLTVLYFERVIRSFLTAVIYTHFSRVQDLHLTF